MGQRANGQLEAVIMGLSSLWNFVAYVSIPYAPEMNLGT